MDNWIDYEASIYALAGEVACPDCGTGLLIPIGPEDATDDTQRLVCDVCDEVLVLTDSER